MKIDLQLVQDILYHDGQLVWDKATLQGIADCYSFLSRFSSDKVIYGINTGFGPMAQWRVEDSHLRDLQYNIIRSHATGMGEPLSDFFVRATMLARVGVFAQCKSGIHPELVTPDSPTQHVGGTVSNSFAPVEHEVPLESLQDVFSDW